MIDLALFLKFTRLKLLKLTITTTLLVVVLFSAHKAETIHTCVNALHTFPLSETAKPAIMTPDIIYICHLRHQVSVTNLCFYPDGLLTAKNGFNYLAEMCR